MTFRDTGDLRYRGHVNRNGKNDDYDQHVTRLWASGTPVNGCYKEGHSMLPTRTKNSRKTIIACNFRTLAIKTSTAKVELTRRLSSLRVIALV